MQCKHAIDNNIETNYDKVKGFTIQNILISNTTNSEEHKVIKYIGKTEKTHYKQRGRKLNIEKKSRNCDMSIF